MLPKPPGGCIRAGKEDNPDKWLVAKIVIKLTNGTICVILLLVKRRSKISSIRLKS